MSNYLFLLIPYISLVSGNLEGPFLFWGPKMLAEYQRPALMSLNQDALMRIYEKQSAIVVFNNQDSVPLSSANFPRLRKMLEGQSTLVLPQDFLDIHPDYISNETQMLTLQGPWSERDAQMTETFARLQDIYGAGRVLGILGNSVSQELAAQYVDTWRVRRQAEESSTAESEPESEMTDKSAKPLLKYAFYNASGPAGNGTLLYSSGWPVLRWEDGSEVALSNPVGEPTMRPTKTYTNLAVKFDHEDSRITVEFKFKKSSDGWWSMAGVEIWRGLQAIGRALPAPAQEAPAAPFGRAYHCSQSLVFSDGNASLTLPDIQVQAFMSKMEKFADAFDCIGFTTAPIWSGIFVSFLMVIGLALSISMIMDIKTMDRFENNRSKQLTITVTE